MGQKVRGGSVGSKEAIAIGDAIIKHRVAAGLTQGELGKELGITSQQLSKFERGDNLIRVAQLLTLCEVFDVSLSEFLGESPDSSCEEGGERFEFKRKKINICGSIMIINNLTFLNGLESLVKEYLAANNIIKE